MKNIFKLIKEKIVALGNYNRDNAISNKVELKKQGDSSVDLPEKDLNEPEPLKADQSEIKKYRKRENVSSVHQRQEQKKPGSKDRKKSIRNIIDKAKKQQGK